MREIIWDVRIYKQPDVRSQLLESGYQAARRENAIGVDSSTLDTLFQRVVERLANGEEEFPVMRGVISRAIACGEIQKGPTAFKRYLAGLGSMVSRYKRVSNGTAAREKLQHELSPGRASPEHGRAVLCHEMMVPAAQPTPVSKPQQLKLL